LPQVGRNLQDHTAVYLGPFFINGSHSLGLFDFRLQNFFDFLTKGAGPFGSTSALSQGFISSSVAKSQGEGDWPDVQLVLSGASICKDCIPYLAHSFNFQQDLMEIYYENAKGKPSFTQIVSNARPLSRGDIRLRSSNPRMAPIIDPNYLDNEHDIRVMVDGIKKALELVENSTTFQKIGTHFTNESFPGCHLEEFRSDKYWECFVRQFTVSLHHVVGTCSMGKSEEAGGVVDSKLRVFGTKRLRVIDASVMPVLPIGNTNWPVTMIGEKGSQMILDFWNSAVESSSVDNANMGENEIGNEKMPSKLRSDLIIQVPDQADPDMPESDRDTVVESTSIRSSVPNSTFEADYDQELSTMAAMIYP
jgi:choline dehydrogenase-like flavoprotein